MFSQVGESASSKSAMNTDARESRALMMVFGSAGPVISTRRSSKRAGAGAIRHFVPAQLEGFRKEACISPSSIDAGARPGRRGGAALRAEMAVELAHEGQRGGSEHVSACATSVRATVAVHRRNHTRAT